MTAEAASDGSVRLSQIYAPIALDLQRLDAFLDAEFRSREPFILKLLSHIAQFRGKQIRPALLLLTARLCRSSDTGGRSGDSKSREGGGPR